MFRVCKLLQDTPLPAITRSDFSFTFLNLTIINASRVLNVWIVSMFPFEQFKIHLDLCVTADKTKKELKYHNDLLKLRTSTSSIETCKIPTFPLGSNNSADIVSLPISTTLPRRNPSRPSGAQTLLLSDTNDILLTF